MTTTLALGAHASQRCFRALLEALANPGRILHIDEPWMAGSGAACVALSLADIDTPMAVVGDERLAAEVAEATRAPLVPVAEARLVALTAPTAELVAECPRGSAVAPELGAMVGLACSHLRATGYDDRQDARPVPAGDEVVTLALSGPGVPGIRRVLVEGLEREVFVALQTANAHFPAGIDVWLVDSQSLVAGLPRSTTIEVM